MNKVYISGYSNIQQFLNNRKIQQNEKAFDYDGEHMQLFSNNNGVVNYEKLSNSDLKGLLRIDYNKHEKNLLKRLEDDLVSSKKRRKTRKHKSKRKSRKGRNTRKTK